MKPKNQFHFPEKSVKALFHNYMAFYLILSDFIAGHFISHDRLENQRRTFSASRKTLQFFSPHQFHPGSIG
jgi:hypothetical protein